MSVTHPSWIASIDHTGDNVSLQFGKNGVCSELKCVSTISLQPFLPPDGDPSGFKADTINRIICK